MTFKVIRGQGQGEEMISVFCRDYFFYKPVHMTFVEYSYQFHFTDVLCYCKCGINGSTKHGNGTTGTKLFIFVLNHWLMLSQ